MKQMLLGAVVALLTVVAMQRVVWANPWEDVVSRDSTPVGNTGGGGSGTIEEVPTCTEAPANVTRNGTEDRDGYRYLYVDGVAYRTSLTTGAFEHHVYRRCEYRDGRVTSEYVWVVITDPDPTIFIPGTVDEVRERVYAPVPSLSPTVRGVVNLGMWLAVSEPAENPVTARASASPTTWAETTATLRTTTFDFGNGDVVTCDGVGDPIPDSAKDSVEPSPVCGYVVEQPGTLAITITSTWEVVSTTSDGDVQVQPDIALSTTVDYEVVEIQTVGRSG